MKAVFFDAGGTLVHIDHPRVAAVIAKVLGRIIDPKGFVEAEYSGRAAVEAGMAKGDLPTDSSRWVVHFRAMLGALGLTDAEFDRVSPAIFEAHRQKHLWSGVYSGTADALASLKQAGYLVAVISNADGHVEELLETVGLREHLEFVVDSGTVGIEKPDPRIFEMAINKARESGESGESGKSGESGLAAPDCYYVGDIFPIDVVGSKAVGMVPVLLDPLGRYGERGCRTITDVPAFCRELVSARVAA